MTEPTGSVALCVGDPEAVVYPRSSTKPVQALALAHAGLRIDAEYWALACASHSGEADHLNAVRELLARHGLPASALQNTPDLPLGHEQREAWIAAGRPPSSLAQNCSGKHAAMLATCVVNGFDPTRYLEPNHPVQRAVRQAWTTLEVEVVDESVDGCGAPAQAIRLRDLARTFGRLASSTSGPEHTIADAMRSHPEFVAGTGRDATAIMRAAPGVIAKDGAEAVYAVGLPDGRGVAVKIADGGERARAVVLGAVLRLIGVGDSLLWDRLAVAPVLGHGVPVGTIRAVLDPS